MPADARFWNKIAPSYAKKPVAHPEAFERKIAKTIAQLPKDALVLDVGCGTGSLALRLAPYAAQVHGLDLSQEMVRIAREKTRLTCVENVSFHVGTLGSGTLGMMQLPPHSLHVVCAFSLLHFIADRGAFFEQVFSALAPGGSFISSTPCLGDSWIPYGPVLGTLHFFGQVPRIYTFSYDELAQELTRAGFVNLKCLDVGAQRGIVFCVARKPDTNAG